MDIFISWSGQPSHAVAEALRDWLPLVLQRAKPFLSSEDIRQGQRWGPVIAARLNSAKFAIVCLTPDNLNAPWLIFESGAVSKDMDTGRVMTLLVGLSATDVTGPLAQFHHTLATKDAIKKLVADINREFEDPLPTTQLDATFEAFWPQLESKITEASRLSKPALKRTTESMLQELIELSRASNKSLDDLALAVSSVQTDLSGESSLGALSYVSPLNSTPNEGVTYYTNTPVRTFRIKRRPPIAKTSPSIVSTEAGRATEDNVQKGLEDKGTEKG